METGASKCDVESLESCDICKNAYNNYIFYIKKASIYSKYVSKPESGMMVLFDGYVQMSQIVPICAILNIGFLI